MKTITTDVSILLSFRRNNCLMDICCRIEIFNVQIRDKVSNGGAQGKQEEFS